MGTYFNPNNESFRCDKRYVPNYEIASAYDLALRKNGWSEVAKMISRCDEVLNATIRKDAEKVAEIVELAHETYTL